MKRLFDIVLSFVALMALSPLFLVIAILIKLGSKGPVFFRGVRIGRYGKPFRQCKFRTMVVDAEKISKVVSIPDDDPRITRVGRFMRRFNLDELPQFVNVLKGEMSIVGPRPELPQWVEIFTEEEQAILTVRPGITDSATVWLKDKGKIFASSEDPDKLYRERVMPEKLRLQLDYVRKRSFWIDFGIMLKTIKTHLFDSFKS